ncbi:MAG: ABC-F family ATP-binding cassette domain-containing protein [Proteobacteria bacterium]|nr:ABC-F family ATP-binding cassette domain-containing protein [Pseudomonadota bacterium]
MTLILSCQSLSKSFGAQDLFTDISLGFFLNERLGLIGPNGSGKSTLLKILAGLEPQDSGEITLRKDTLLVYLPQEEKLESALSIEETILKSLDSDKLEDTELYLRVQKTLAWGEFEDPDKKVSTLSGGWRKRLAISCALVREPDLLLMDEPTNHLDLEGIIWLEKTIKNQNFAFVLVSHDRYFLENCTNRIIELSRQYPGGVMKSKGNYSDFLLQKQNFLEGQSSYQSTLTNKLRRETEWLQRGPKARSTKARYRIDEAQRIKDELQAVQRRNSHTLKMDIEFDATDRKTKKLMTLENLKKAMGIQKLFNQLNLTFTPGEKIGLLGRNGTGKSTLLKIISGDIKADGGNIKKVDGLKVILFDQNREQLDQRLSLRQALSPAGDALVYRGKSIHVVGWAKRFLFRSDQLETPVSRLSGGEQARILIANLMLQEADILLLDEPTNDLDIPSLEILEESLQDFPGAILLITHDRFLLEKVATKILYLSGRGDAELFEDYYQWQNHHRELKKFRTHKTKQKKAHSKKIKRLSYKENIEFDQIEGKIEVLEGRLNEQQTYLEKTDVIADSRLLNEGCEKLQKIQKEIDDLYTRWSQLEELKTPTSSA